MAQESIALNHILLPLLPQVPKNRLRPAKTAPDLFGHQAKNTGEHGAARKTLSSPSVRAPGLMDCPTLTSLLRTRAKKRKTIPATMFLLPLRDTVLSTQDTGPLIPSPTPTERKSILRDLSLSPQITVSSANLSHGAASASTATSALERDPSAAPGSRNAFLPQPTAAVVSSPNAEAAGLTKTWTSAIAKTRRQLASPRSGPSHFAPREKRASEQFATTSA